MRRSDGLSPERAPKLVAACRDDAGNVGLEQHHSGGDLVLATGNGDGFEARVNAEPSKQVADVIAHCCGAEV